MEPATTTECDVRLAVTKPHMKVSIAIATTISTPVRVRVRAAGYLYNVWVFKSCYILSTTHQVFLIYNKVYK